MCHMRNRKCPINICPKIKYLQMVVYNIFMREMQKKSDIWFIHIHMSSIWKCSDIHFILRSVVVIYSFFDSFCSLGDDLIHQTACDACAAWCTFSHTACRMLIVIVKNKINYWASNWNVKKEKKKSQLSSNSQKMKFFTEFKMTSSESCVHI